MNAPGILNETTLLETSLLGDGGDLARPPAVPEREASGAWNRVRCQALIDQLSALRDELLAAEAQRAQCLSKVSEEYRASARNLIHYLALRQHDRRHLQEELARLGLSSLGRSESHVLANLNKVIGVLHALTDQPWHERSAEEPVGLQDSQRLLQQHSRALLGNGQASRAVRIMVTLPAEAAHDYGMVYRTVEAGMDLARINCAHDDAEAWAAMAQHVRRAATELGVTVRILMDLGGPKLRTGDIASGPSVLRLRPERDDYGRVVRRARLRLYPLGSLTAVPAGEAAVAVDPDWLAALEPGEVVQFTDARDKRRRLNIVCRDGEDMLAESDRSAYLMPGMRLRRANRCKGPRMTAVDGVPAQTGRVTLTVGDQLRLTRPGAAESRAESTQQLPSISCTLPEVFAQVREGERIWFDDGKIGGVIREASADELLVEIISARPGGSRLASDKGINLPDSRLELPALTLRDIEDLHIVARHADLVGLSFVQHGSDVENLHALLDGLGAHDIGMVLKIETRRAFEHLPELMLAAMGSRHAGVMIARGDLAVECGYERLAEVQEEILWAAEAAHMPVIWATQVLETLAKTGQPSRAEITDAAMGERAECVMLNKGPHILSAIRVLDDILQRMQFHQDKKRALLRALGAWATAAS